jgi:hypothetical protein
VPSTKLVYAVEMLHYLPLFIAHERELRNELDIALAPRPHGDKSAIESLMSTAIRDAHVHFCICDPMMVSLEDAYAAVGGDEPVVIGQLVGKVPFWAVDHMANGFHDEECFGEFSQIFAYPEPNTGFIFGKLVYSPFERTRKNSLHFRPEKPIDADLDRYLNGTEATVVIEADILKIRKFTEKTGNKVVYSFAGNAEYKNFCFTAILSHKSFLQTASGQAQARHLLGALIRATDLIYTYRDLALNHAVSRFQPQGYTTEIIDGALRDLITENVFSRSPIVRRDGWQKSGFVRRQIETKFDFPSFRKFVDNRIAAAEFSTHLRGKTVGGRYLFADLSRLVTALRRGAAPLVFAVLYFLPAFIVNLRPRLPSVLWNPWMLFHFLVTTFVVAIYCLRARISHWAKRDPTKWLEWGIGIVVAYGIGELGIIAELIKSLAESKRD